MVWVPSPYRRGQDSAHLYEYRVLSLMKNFGEVFPSAIGRSEVSGRHRWGVRVANTCSERKSMRIICAIDLEDARTCLFEPRKVVKSFWWGVISPVDEPYN